jgi:hypothetical protein
MKKAEARRLAVTPAAGNELLTGHSTLTDILTELQNEINNHVPSQDYEKTANRYRNTPQWMKAPNGENSNLTERQWVTVRTDTFKKLFGDWEAASRAQPIKDMESVQITSKAPVDKATALDHSDVEIYENDEADSRSRNNRAETGQSPFTDVRLREFFESVNSSIVLDENGEPRIGEIFNQFDEGDLDAYVSEGSISFEDEIRIAEWLGMSDAQEAFTPEQTARMEEAVELYERTGKAPEGMEDVFSRIASARFGEYADVAEGAIPAMDEADTASVVADAEAGAYDR